MTRWAVRIAVFLLLGAIVNVAVAWGVVLGRPALILSPGGGLALGAGRHVENLGSGRLPAHAAAQRDDADLWLRDTRRHRQAQSIRPVEPEHRTAPVRLADACRRLHLLERCGCAHRHVDPQKWTCVERRCKHTRPNPALAPAVAGLRDQHSALCGGSLWGLDGVRHVAPRPATMPTHEARPVPEVWV